MRPAGVCDQPALAAILLAGGANVVLCGSDAAALAEAAAPLAGPPGPPSPGPPSPGAARGRLALFVGDPPAAGEEALAMATELFGDGAVVVASVSEAVQLLARTPGSDDLASGTVDTHP